MSYIESKKEINKIRSKYSCSGDIIMRTAIQYIVEYGQYMFKDEEFIKDQKQQVNDRHDIAEKEGKLLWITRDLELALIDCAIELAEINTYDLIIYMQKEMYWSNEGGLDYKRAIKIAEKVMDWVVYASLDSSEDYDTFSNECGIEDDELEELGFGYMIPKEEEEE